LRGAWERIALRLKPLRPPTPLTWGSALPAGFPFSSCRGVQPRQGWTSHNCILLDSVDRRVWVQSAPGAMGAGAPPPLYGCQRPREQVPRQKGGSPACPDGNRHRTMQAPRGTLRVSECPADRAGRIGRSECPTDQAPRGAWYTTTAIRQTHRLGRVTDGVRVDHREPGKLVP
jgi:hypothetical protein